MNRNINENPYTQKILDISTGHLTKKDNDLLKDEDSMNNPISSYKFEYGYFVHVSEDSMEELTPIIKSAGYSDEFLIILSKAKELKCSYIKFDSDGFLYTDLNSFDW